MSEKLRLAFAGGGTAGHLYPARNLLKVFEKKVSCEALFFGTDRGIESEKVPAWGYRLETLPVRGFQRRLTAANLSFPYRLWQSLRMSRAALNRFRPHVVIGTGGYVMGPVLKSALKAGLPAVIQEQNSYPGVTTRLLAARVEKVYCAYDEAVTLMPGANCRVVANPVAAPEKKTALAQARRELGLHPGKKTVLVFGGSLGAGSINRAVARWLEAGDRPDVQLIWQTGKRQYEMYAPRFGNRADVRMRPFIEDMWQAYAAADFAVCRAGAMSLAELAIAGLPAILVPLASAAGDHQTKNARALEARDAARLLKDDDRLDENLSVELKRWLADDGLVKRLKENMARLGNPGAADIIVDDILRLLKEKKIWSGYDTK